MKKTLLISSVGVVILVIYAALAQNEWTEYVTHQKAYRDFLVNIDPDAEYPIEMRHLVLPAMNRIDRCVTCHVGMEDPRAKDLPHPLKTHPGDYLAKHNIQTVGFVDAGFIASDGLNVWRNVPAVIDEASGEVLEPAREEFDDILMSEHHELRKLELAMLSQDFPEDFIANGFRRLDETVALTGRTRIAHDVFKALTRSLTGHLYKTER